MKTSSSRRRLISLIHAASSRLGLEDGEYRAVLFSVTGKDSCADCSDPELREILAAFNRLLFQANLEPFGLSGTVTLADAVRFRARIILGEKWETRLQGFLAKLGKKSLSECGEKEMRRAMAFLSAVERRGK